MTRGRHRNDAYIVTTGESTALDLFCDAVARSWIDQPALARQAELAGTNRHRPGTLPGVELRALFDQLADFATRVAEDPATEALRAEATDRLADDRYFRTRSVRGEQPDRITDTLGPRPFTGRPARAWDVAAGYLDQHQAAFGFSAGFGRMDAHDQSGGFLHSRALVDGAVRKTAETIRRERRPVAEVEAPSLGLGL